MVDIHWPISDKAMLLVCTNKNTVPQMEVRSSQPTEGQEDPERYRFQVELEFVQCLANPKYLNFLAQRGYLKEKEFVNYLDYLQYWKRQEYAKFLKYPQCLHFLDLLQSEHFRRELANTQCTKFIEEQQLLHWHHYTKKRMHFQQQIFSQGKPPVNK